MQLTAVFLALALSVSAHTLSQTITFSGKDVRLPQIINVVKQQTGYLVVYADGLLETAGPITIFARNLALDDFLRQVLQDQPLEFSLEGRNIFIGKKKAIQGPTVTLAEHPPITVHGRIVNEKGEGVVASIIVKGTKLGTIANSGGEFTLQDVSENATLTVSGISIESLDIQLNGRSVLTITVRTKISTEEEVEINAGYYTVKDKERTGNISKIGAREIAKQPVTNLMGALIGRVPGLEVVQSTGTPGGAFTVRIRGQNSIAAGNDPMYIVDGVPFSSESLGNSTVSRMLPLTGVNPLNSLNPGDILSIEILKDADATAIYGSRGANGVVLITTKKGRAGKTKFDMQATMGASRVTRFMDLMNTEQYLAMRKEAFANDGISEYPASAVDVNGVWSQTRYTDLQKELIGGTAKTHNIQASISGGSEFTQFLVRGGYQRETTIFPGDFRYGRINTLVNLTHRSSDNRFKMTLSNIFSTDDNNVTSNDLSMHVTLPPNVPAFYNADGSLNWENNTWDNPLAKLNARYDGRTRTLNASASLSYEVMKDFSFRLNLGYTDSRIDEINAVPHTVYNPVYGLGSASSSLYQNTGKRESWIIEPQLSWQQRISQGSLQLLAGTTFQQESARGITQLGYGFPSNSQISDMSSATSVYPDRNINTVYKYQALFGRANYNWKEKYIVNLTARYDGSSRFGPGKQFAAFGAAGAAWIFSRELPVANALPWLSFGKIRTSYGVTGNDQIGDYEYLDTYGPSYSVYQINGLEAQRLYNPDFAWETNKKLEAGLETGFLQDRLFLSVSWYRNRSSNQLVGMPLSAVTGFSSIRSNLDAVVENTGWEWEVRSTNIQHKRFTWTTGANLTIPRNKLVAFPGLAGSTYANQYVVGRSLSISRLYNITGFDTQTGAYQFEDIDKDGIISAPNDRQFFLDRNVKWYGGLSNTLTLGDWQADIFVQFTRQTTLSSFFMIPIPGMMVNQPVAVQNRWPVGGEGAIFQPYTTQNDDIIRAHYRASSSSWALEDRSFIRLKNVSVSYKLSANWMKGSEWRFFAQGQNLLTFTKFRFADPEVGFSSYVPPFKTVVAGMQLTF